MPSPGGEKIGSDAFIRATRAQPGSRYAPSVDHITFGIQMHANSWCGGQFLFVDPDSGTVVALFSVPEDDSAADFSCQLETIAMAEAISLMDPV